MSFEMNYEEVRCLGFKLDESVPPDAIFDAEWVHDQLYITMRCAVHQIEISGVIVI